MSSSSKFSEDFNGTPAQLQITTSDLTHSPAMSTSDTQVKSSPAPCHEVAKVAATQDVQQHEPTRRLQQSAARPAPAQRFSQIEGIQDKILTMDDLTKKKVPLVQRLTKKRSDAKKTHKFQDCLKKLVAKR
jgi:hypothetical protein